MYSFCFDFQSQDTTKTGYPVNTLGISINPALSSYREDLLVPVSFDGPSIMLGAVFTRWQEHDYYKIHFRFGFGYLQNRFSHESAVIKLDLISSWLKKIKRYQRYGEIWAGIQLPIQMNDLYLFSWDDAHLYWLTVYSLGPAIGWKKELSAKYDIFIRFHFPVFNLVSRPPAYRYNNQDALNHIGFHFSEPHKALHFESLEDYRSFTLQIDLIKNKKVTGWNFGLEFQYDYFRKPKPISSIHTSLLASYAWGI
jgi:hypothetical protein